MSIKLMSAVWDIELAPGEKLVLLALADQANDDGRQCWPSVETIAHRSGQGVRTVRRALESLETKGHLTRHHRDGTSTQYHVHPCQNGSPVKSAPLPKTTRTPAKLAPKPSRTIKSKNTEARAHVLPADWKPAEFGLGTKSRSMVDGWPPGELAAQLEHFTAHHSGKGNRFVDWQAAWSTWVLNGRRYGNARTGRNSPANDEPANPYVRAALARASDRAAAVG